MYKRFKFSDRINKAEPLLQQRFGSPSLLLFRLVLFQIRLNLFRESFIAFRVEMKLIFNEKIRPWLVVCTDGDRLDVDEVEPFILLTNRTDLPVRFADLLPILPSALAQLDRDVDKLRLGQFLVKFFDKLLEIGDHHLG